MKAMFNTVAARLTDQVPALKRVARWNNQTAGAEANERALVFPCVYLELLPTQAVTQTRDVQHCQGMLRVRLVATTRDPDANLDLAQLVYRALQHFQAMPLLVAMERRALFQDTNTSTLEHLVQDFTVKWVDDSRQAPTTPANAPLVLTTE